jgi:hypothetical protein
MKIELETPYKEIWKKGYLVVNPENRRNVILYNSHSHRSTVSYARYLMSVKLGKFIPEGFEVDHIDDDKTNDSIDNLQILTTEENRQKRDALQRKLCPTSVELKCYNCGKLFNYPSHNYRFHTKNGRTKFHCSRECSYESLRKKKL